MIRIDRCKLALITAALSLGVAVLLLLPGTGSAVAQPSEHPFEIVPGSFGMALSTGKTLSSAGEPDYQAGAHADWTFTFDFAHDSEGRTFNDIKRTVINVPAGFMGNANKFGFPTCTDAQLVGKNAGQPECPPGSQVGTITLDLALGEKPVLSTFPVYFMEVTSFGVTAELGFNAIELTQTIPIVVRPADSGITSMTRDVQDTGEAHNLSVTIWGLPAAKEHDPERGRACYEQGELNVATCKGGGEEAGVGEMPFLANPTSCGMFTASMSAGSWEEPLALPSTASAEVGPVTGCERVHFDPSIKVQPTTDSVESPSGLDVSLEVPQTWESANAFATSNLKDTRVRLPEGYTVNPSAGSGLVGCMPAQYAAEASSSPPGAGCPPESKLGKVNIETPVLAERITGDVYLAQPFDNPFDSLLALYIVAKAPDRGIIIKAAGKVEPNPVTGQLVTTFNNTSQQPFSRFTLEFKQGQTSPLVSPPVCGIYTVLAELTPWSAPSEPRSLSNSFAIESGVGGGPCPSGGVPPFNPAVVAGTQSNAAASYSPFYLRIARSDGEQELTKFSTVMPPGLTGNLTGIPFCPDGTIEAARRATGQNELSAPSCPAASEIGHTLVGAGVGGVLAWTPGKLYLAGSYHGAPFSLVSVTSATVGPFDLGTVVIRFALRINPVTSQVEVDSSGSDPIPHIINGIVVHVRDIHAYVNRSRFILNPTSCNPMSIDNVISGAGANPADSAAQTSAGVATRFQASGCQGLKFKPIFKVSTSGKTSRKNGASLHVSLTYPKAAQGTQANIHSVKVDLPKQLPSRLTTLQKACPVRVFNADPAVCPAAARVGDAKAVTPVLPVPLTGPAYFVSNGGAKFPELVIVLQGYGVTIDLHGETFINEKTNVTSSTFRTVPDQPVTSFELTLPQGPDSALAANGDLCHVRRRITRRKQTVVKVHGHRRTVVKKTHKTVAAALTMPTMFTAQNGATINTTTLITVTGCRKNKSHSYN
ncbi:MAG: hypothetical protein ACRD4Q_00820 [Candidatus Acidiferrales bacterium]